MNWSPLFCFLHFMGHDLAELWSQILHCQPYWNGFLWFVLRTFEQQKQQQLESCFYHQKTGSSAKKIREIWKQPKSLSIKSLLFKFRRLEDYWWWLLKRSLWFPRLFFARVPREMRRKVQLYILLWYSQCCLVDLRVFPSEDFFVDVSGHDWIQKSSDLLCAFF